ncbi:MAG: SOUL family heme-binding protein [Acholeplasmataceae bacterium]
MAYEQLKYDILKKEGHIEIRKYAPFVMMKSGSPSYSGFQVLFNYISGYNSKKQKISMTVPVFTDVKESGYIAFTMPEEVVKNGYPEALDSRINIEKQEEKTYLSYSYVGSIKKVDTIIKILHKYAENNELKIHGDPVLLRYQGPMVPPIFRKHDVMLEIIF